MAYTTWSISFLPEGFKASFQILSMLYIPFFVLCFFRMGWLSHQLGYYVSYFIPVSLRKVRSGYLFWWKIMIWRSYTWCVYCEEGSHPGSSPFHGGGNSNFLYSIFTPILGEIDPIWLSHIFQVGLEKKHQAVVYLTNFSTRLILTWKLSMLVWKRLLTATCWERCSLVNL